MARNSGENCVKVAFLGNHTVGVTALATIAQTDEVVGVIAHPFDPEDGVRYQSVFDFAKTRGWPVIRGKGRDSSVEDFLQYVAPDLIWVTDYRYLLPSSVLAKAKLGAVNLHPSLLPAYRGRAPINWAILEGETLLGLTAHFIDAGMDSGDIVAQIPFELAESEDVGDALDKLYPIYEAVTHEVLQAFRTARINRIPQDERKAFTRPARRPGDGLIDWNQSSAQVCNLVRAVAAPYPGAFTYLDRNKVTVWRAVRALNQKQESTPGEVIGFDSAGNPIVRCADTAIVLTEFEAYRQVAIGDYLGSVV
jgi:methionyl-tRNA formyltransferase